MAGWSLHLYPIVFQSERQDLNLRSPGPRPGAITRLRHVLIEYPVRESNPCLRIESPLSFTVRRTGHVLFDYVRSAQVGWVALESTSPALQTSARPSQLPAQQRKNPVPFATPGLGDPTESGQVSQTQTAHGQRIRRLSGKTRINAMFGYETRP